MLTILQRSTPYLLKSRAYCNLSINFKEYVDRCTKERKDRDERDKRLLVHRKSSPYLSLERILTIERNPSNFGNSKETSIFKEHVLLDLIQHKHERFTDPQMNLFEQLEKGGYFTYEYLTYVSNSTDYFSEACYYGRPELVKYFMDLGLKNNSDNPINKEVPKEMDLHYMLFRGCEGLLKGNEECIECIKFVRDLIIPYDNLLKPELIELIFKDNKNLRLLTILFDTKTVCESQLPNINSKLIPKIIEHGNINIINYFVNMDIILPSDMYVFGNCYENELGNRFYHACKNGHYDLLKLYLELSKFDNKILTEGLYLICKGYNNRINKTSNSIVNLLKTKSCFDYKMNEEMLNSTCAESIYDINNYVNCIDIMAMYGAKLDKRTMILCIENGNNNLLGKIFDLKYKGLLDDISPLKNEIYEFARTNSTKEMRNYIGYKVLFL